MITSVAYRPTWVAPAYNPIIWSVLSSKVNSTDFKYVFDIYINGIKINRIKQRANPSGYGMIDVSTLVEGYIDPSSPTAKLNQGETTINWQIGQVYSDNTDMSLNVYIKVGEEYTLNGQTLIYIGSADVPGEPAYAVYSGAATPNIPVQSICASLTDHEQQWHMQKTGESGVFGDNPFYANRNYDHTLGTAYPLIYGPLEQDLYLFDKMVVSWLNWSPFNSDTQNRPIYGFEFKVYDATGALEATYDIPMYTATGFAQRSTCSSTINSTLDSKYALVHVLASPVDLITALEPQAQYTLAPGWRIEITGYDKATQCAFGETITNTITINIKEYCPDPLYQRVRLSWFNTLGGRDYFNFTAFQEKTISTKQDSYAQEQMNWNRSTPVPLLNDSPIIQNLGIRGGMKPFNKTVDTVYKIETDWLTQDQVALLEGLQKSPQVVAYIHDDINTLSDYYGYTAMVSNASYTIKNIRQQKMVQATFDLKLVSTQKIQNL